jgi:hypothetical protein
MPQLNGHFDTPNGPKYLQQLCKHFAHKTEARFTETEGRVSFGFGTAHMSADDAGLSVRFDLDAADTEDRARMVIDKHLARFAFREGFEHMTWQALA